MTGRWRWIRLVASVALLVFIVWRLGAGPFLAGIRSLDAGRLAAAAGIGLITISCCAVRWSVVATGVGVGIPFRAALPAYYRSSFLNSVLPGGILGDVHRGVRHGQESADVGLALRAVGWERLGGQVVQIVITAVVLLTIPSPMRGLSRWLLVGVGAVVLVGAALLSRRSGSHTRTGRIALAAAHDLRAGLLDRRRLPVVVLASTVVVVGHTATFIIAAQAVGTTATTMELIPAALVVLAAMAIPTSLGGWGPREGASAAVFAAAGWGAATGVAAATAYGVMALFAVLPGAVVLMLGARLGRGRAATDGRHRTKIVATTKREPIVHG